MNYMNSPIHETCRPGLLLANALCHAQLGDREREAQAAQGLRQLTEAAFRWAVFSR